MQAERDRRGAIASALRNQAGWCARLGSPLYEHLLTHTATDVEAGGPAWQLLREVAPDPPGMWVALQLMGAVHRLVLTGAAPSLAKLYPSAGGRLDVDRVWREFRVVLEHRDLLAALVRRPIQTNEVGRAAALAGAFLVVARDTGLPLRILEIGASAGLNLRWDKYRYHSGQMAWGDPASPVTFREPVVEGTPPFAVQAEVVARGGCDLQPLDPTSEEGRLTLTSYVWADQRERLQALRGALDVAALVPITIDRADAADWLAEQLTEPRCGVATVVFHSIFIQYVSAEGRQRIWSVMHDAGSRATPAAPIAWLWMEPGGGQAEVRLTTWPGGEARVLARSGFHGPPVRWLET